MGILRNQVLIIGSVPVVLALAYAAFLPRSPPAGQHGARVVARASSATDESVRPMGVLPRAGGAFDAAPQSPIAPAASAAPLASSSANSDDVLARLDAAFATSDVLSGDETLDEVVTAGNTAALPPLEHLELASNPELGPKIIATIGKLGKLGSPRERDQAVDTLSQWLESERRREAPDARGNRTALIHALGELNTAAGSTTLTRVLDDDTTPLHVRTLIVEQLASSRLPEAAASIRRFQTRLASAPATDPFEAELLQEAAVAANTALGNPLDPNQNN